MRIVELPSGSARARLFSIDEKLHFMVKPGSVNFVSKCCFAPWRFRYGQPNFYECASCQERLGEFKQLSEAVAEDAFLEVFRSFMPEWSALVASIEASNYVEGIMKEWEEKVKRV